jgi:hypothetical protein
MMSSKISGTLFAMVVAASITFSAHVVEGQARGTEAERAARDRGSAEIDRRPRPELQRRVSAATREVPPGWCIGTGNPHNTPANCGERARLAEPRDRGSTRTSSFDEAHARFHRDLDQRCRARAEQRPLDLQWQVRVRAECRTEHDRWHARHDPTWNDR